MSEFGTVKKKADNDGGKNEKPDLNKIMLHFYISNKQKNYRTQLLSQQEQKKVSK